MKFQKKNLTGIVTVLLIISTVFTGCATFDRFSEQFIDKDNADAKIVRIGIFEPLTGENKDDAKYEIQGIELAHDLYPEILGKKVELVYGDNKSDVDFAKTAAEDLADKRVSAVIGSWGNTLSLVGSEVFEKAKIPAIAVSASNPLVTSSEYYFRACFIESFQGVAMAKYAVEQAGAVTAVVVKDSGDDYAAAISQAFSDKFIALTEKESSMVGTFDYKKGSDDYRKKLESIKALNPDVIFLAGNVSDTALIVRQAREIGIDSAFLGVHDWENQEFLEKGGQAVEGAAFASANDVESSISEYGEILLKAYREKFGEAGELNSNVALGFDAYLLALNAIGSAGTSLDTEAIKAKLAETRDFPGASGNISFDPNGDPIKSVVIKTIANGEFVYTYTVEPVWQ